MVKKREREAREMLKLEQAIKVVEVSQEGQKEGSVGEPEEVILVNDELMFDVIPVDSINNLKKTFRPIKPKSEKAAVLKHEADTLPLKRTLSLPSSANGKSTSCVVATPLNRSGFKRKKYKHNSKAPDLSNKDCSLKMTYNTSATKSAKTRKAKRSLLDLTSPEKQPKVLITRLPSLEDIESRPMTGAGSKQPPVIKELVVKSSPDKQQTNITSSSSNATPSADCQLKTEGLPQKIQIEMRCQPDQYDQQTVTDKVVNIVQSLQLQSEAIKVIVSPGENGNPLFTIMKPETPMRN